MLRAIKGLVIAAIGIFLVLTFLITNVFQEKFFGFYLSKLDAWVVSGGPTGAIQTQVIGNCGKLVMSQAGFFSALNFMSFNREEFHFKTDVCLKITVNRVYKQPEFENPRTVQTICAGSDDFLRRMCSHSGLVVFN